MSDNGACVLVDLVMLAQPRMNNSSDKNDSVWASDIHVKFMKKVQKGDLPPTDGRSVQALKSRRAAVVVSH